MTHGEVKTLISMAATPEQADTIISNTYCKTDADKIAYIKQLFGIEGMNEDIDHEAYFTLLNAVVNQAGTSDYDRGFKAGYDMGFADGKLDHGKTMP